MGRPIDTEATDQTPAAPLLMPRSARRQDDDSRFLVTQTPNPNDTRDSGGTGPANKFYICSQCPARFRDQQAFWDHFETHSARLPYIR